MLAARWCHPDVTILRGACNLGPFRGVPKASPQRREGYVMQTLPLPKVRQRPLAKPEPSPFEGDLLDLYGAILIVIPLALILKSLWA
jgi:hypothetical protein